MKNCLRALPVCSLVNDKGIESTFYKAPRPSARVLTLSHAPTPKQKIRLCWPVSISANCVTAGNLNARMNPYRIYFNSYKGFVLDLNF